MPTKTSVLKFARTRWLPLIRKSPRLRALIDRGVRYDVTNLEQMLGASIVDMVWSNSPSALSSVPARVVILDEVDKFARETEEEADAVQLAEQRTKQMPNPKRIKVSTPTVESGLVWQELLKSDLRRRFLPCPFCGQYVVLAWSKDYTIFPVTGAEAFAFWDPAARRPDREWDLDRVERTAHYVCPYCKGKIQDAMKTAMDRSGQWRPTRSAAHGFRGYHLPSLYAASQETTVGRLAVKFLQAKRGLQGLHGFLNSELAEPMANQDSRGERFEVITEPDAPPMLSAQKILTADHQILAPKLWFVVREWLGNSRLIDYGALNSWEELREKQLEHKIPDNLVGIDSGDATDEVYKACLQYGVLRRSRAGSAPMWIGWTPMKGFWREMAWRDPKTKLPRPWGFGNAAIEDVRFRLPLLQFQAEAVTDMLENLRRRKTRWNWEIPSDTTEEYFLHLDAEIRKEIWNPRSRRLVMQWQKRTRVWPDHLRDAEKMQVVMALRFRLLTLLPERNPQTSTSTQDKQP
jgi:hypothetical protein